MERWYCKNGYGFILGVCEASRRRGNIQGEERVEDEELVACGGKLSLSRHDSQKLLA
jgi:hypothetical protein